MTHILHLNQSLFSREKGTRRRIDVETTSCVYWDIMPEIKEALLKRGYVLVIIGGGVTGDIQINDTDLHSPLKAKYRELEQLLMIDQLKANPKKIPQPSRDDMMRMLSESFEAVEIDVVTHFKSLWVTNALDGSEDYLVSE